MKGSYQGKDAIRRAYEDYVRPQLEQRRKTEEEARINSQVEERLKTRMAELGASLPVDNGAPGFRGSSIFHPKTETPITSITSAWKAECPSLACHTVGDSPSARNTRTPPMPSKISWHKRTSWSPP